MLEVGSYQTVETQRKHQSQPVDNVVMEPESKRRRVSNSLKDESLSTAFVVSTASLSTPADLPGDKIKSGDLVDENKAVQKGAESRIEIKKCRYEAKDIGDENEIEIEFKDESKRIIFEDYFKIIAKNKDEVTTVCRNCKLIKESDLKQPIALRIHLMVCNI